MRPEFLCKKDEIRIISPSGTINPDYINGAIKILEEWGLKVTEGKYTRSSHGRFGGTKEERISDIQDAINDPNVKAILCSRGGYGVAQIIDSIDFSTFIDHPKWVIGFSDITVFHNTLTCMSIESIHSIMTKHLTELAPNSDQVQLLKNLLFGQLPHYSIKTENENREGKAEGTLIGGNLSVFMGLTGTKIDLPYKNNILFIEEIGEEPYHIDRMIQNLRLNGTLSEINGLIVGQFTDCNEDPSMMQTIREIILEATKEYKYPICFNFPAGHVPYNLPLIMGSEVYFEVNTQKSILKFL